jgi:hypothetical protein
MGRSSANSRRRRRRYGGQGLLRLGEDKLWCVSSTVTDPFFRQYDAPIGYPSITANFTPEWKQWWFNPENVKLYQFMGKDNVYFHTVLWPACLLGDGQAWTRLFYISATGKRSTGDPELTLTRHTRVSQLRGRQVFKVAELWRVRPTSEGDGHTAGRMAILSTSKPTRNWRYYVLLDRIRKHDSTTGLQPLTHSTRFSRTTVCC